MVTPVSPLNDASPAFNLKGGSFTATILELLTVDPDHVAAQLQARMQDASAWLMQSPVILNLDKVADADENTDWKRLIALCQSRQVSLVGIRAPEHLQVALKSLGLPLLPGLKRKGAEVELAATAPVSVPAPAAVATPAPAREVAATGGAPTRIITQPVRGGQQIYAAGDLIVLSAVSAGAEVLADGNIHIYGPLRGRALAGVQGNAEARIFCQTLEAELISIAGRYRVAEDLRKTPQWGKATQVALTEEVLNLLTL